MKKITVQDIEEIVRFNISDNCKTLIKEFDLTYRELTQTERDQVILNIVNVLNDDIEFVGKHRLEKWENGWFENLELLKQNKDINSLIPKYFNKYNIARWKGDFIKCETEYFDYKLHIILVDAILHKIVGSYYSNLYEFGCGPAYHLLRFGNFNPNINLIGLDWAVASQNIIKEINKLEINNKITGYNFDYFNPDYNININKNSAIFTCASLEQIGENYKEFVDYLITKKPEVCIHFEPSSEILNENNLVDKLSILYFNKRKYLKGYLTYLKQLEQENKIEIIKTQRLYGGSYFIEGYPVIIWKPKNK
jgi:hypothetical protein